jgi:hypothetical protein
MLLDNDIANCIEWGKHYEAEEIRKQDEREFEGLL